MFGNRLVFGDSRILFASVVAIASGTQQKNEKKECRRGASSNNCFKSAKKRCTNLVRQKMIEIGMPGAVVGVSVNGENVWTKGFGYADIENSVPCTADTLMRIASISKSLTMAAVARLLEFESISLDEPIQKYLPDFPKKYHENEEVKLTTRMLLSHTSGIRHYQKKPTNCEESNSASDDKNKIPEYENPEYFSMKPYKNVTEALDMFKDDLLFHKPGEKFLYTTHGWTLVSAVVEKASGEDFLLHMKKMFHKLGMHKTLPEYATEIVYNRSRQYERNKKGRLINVSYVDNSYKWAGGGFISNVADLIKFGNAMLYSFQSDTKFLPGFLKSDTVKKMWSPSIKRSESDQMCQNRYYGMGWAVHPSSSQEFGCGNEYNFEVFHTGGAIGGSSILYVLPIYPDNKKKSSNDDLIEIEESNELSSLSFPVGGIVIAILTNLQQVDLTELARMIAQEFKSVLEK